MSEIIDPSLADRSLRREERSSTGKHLHGAFNDVYIPLCARIYTQRGTDIHRTFLLQYDKKAIHEKSLSYSRHTVK